MMFSPGCACCGGGVFTCTCYPLASTVHITIWAQVRCFGGTDVPSQFDCATTWTFALVLDGSTGCWRWSGHTALGLYPTPDSPPGTHHPGTQVYVDDISLCCFVDTTWNVSLSVPFPFTAIPPQQTVFAETCSPLLIDNGGGNLGGPNLTFSTDPANVIGAAIMASWGCPATNCTPSTFGVLEIACMVTL